MVPTGLRAPSFDRKPLLGTEAAEVPDSDALSRSPTTHAQSPRSSAFYWKVRHFQG